jgi:hypothetical protein
MTYVILTIAVLAGVAAMVNGCGLTVSPMPGQSFTGQLPTPSATQKQIVAELRRDLTYLAEEIGERNVSRRYKELQQSADFIVDSFTKAGLAVSRQGYEVSGRTCENIIGEVKGSEKPDEIIVIGGHYDTVPNCAGANDNGTGTVATLAMARLLAKTKPKRTLRFVGFVNEEPPYFQTSQMGSVVYAKSCRAKQEKIVAMLSLETMGFFSDQAGSQKYPGALAKHFPSTGNFIAFVGNDRSKPLVERLVKDFRGLEDFPCEGLAMNATLPGVGWSDHWSFWKQGYLGVMVTDTAPFRYPHYHTPDDTVDKVDFDRLSRVVVNLDKVVRKLANE